MKNNERNRTSPRGKSSNKSPMPRSGKMLLIIFTIIIIVLILAITTLTIMVFMRLKSVHDPDVHFSDRSGEYSVPLTPSGLDLSIAESYDEDDWNTSIPIPEESGSDSDVSNNTSQSTGGNNGGGGNWTWKPKNIPIIKRDPIDENVINLLVLGVDSMDSTSSGGRTDTMIVASYNKTTGEINLISLLRDSFVPIEEHNWNRLNTAYFFGGVGLCINTINDVFSLDIQNYIMVDFSSLPKLIDNIGGIDVELSEAEVEYYKKVYGWDVVVGNNHLNGSMALKHARNRSVGFSDFARTSRQRDLLTKIINKVLNTNDLVSTITLINSSLDLIRTNLPPGDIINLATSVYGGPDVTIDTMHMPIDGTFQSMWYGKMLVMQIDIEENRDAIREMLYGS